MRSLILGVLTGAFGAWVYYSKLDRDRLRQQLSNAPAPVRQRAESLASAAASGSQRVADVLDASPLPRQVKDRAVQATTAIQSAAERARGVGKTAEGQQPPATVVENPAPEEVRAEEDAAARAAADALREQQTGG
jgi:hypothetical protein